MISVMTLTGAISPYELGHCQCHEHIMLKKGISYLINPALCMDDFEKSRLELLSYAAAGGQSIIDAQPGGCCRMESALQQLSVNTKVHIIASTGFHKLCFYPPEHWIHTISQESMYEFIVHELTRGMFFDIDNSPPTYWKPFRAGIIKCAYDKDSLTPTYMRLWKAAVAAAQKTNVPLMVHMEQNISPEKLLNFLQYEGMNMKRLVLCHLDRSILPLNMYLSILKRGVFLEFDTIGRFKYHDDQAEIHCIRSIIDAGYGNQLLLSLDTTRERMKAYYSKGIGLDYILSCFIPQLKSSGFSEQEIYQLTVTNCTNVFI